MSARPTSRPLGTIDPTARNPLRPWNEEEKARSEAVAASVHWWAPHYHSTFDPASAGSERKAAIREGLAIIASWGAHDMEEV